MLSAIRARTHAIRIVLAAAVVATACATSRSYRDRGSEAEPRPGDKASVLGGAERRHRDGPSAEAGSRPAGGRGSKPMRFAVTGDHGTGGSAQYSVAGRMCAWRRNHPFRHVFTTGDNVYDSGEPSRFQDTFFDPYSCLLDRGVRFRSTLGNHDVRTANGYYQVARWAFGYKKQRKNYVVRKRGVRFVVANATDLRERWLRKKTRAQSGDRWTIVIFHFPVYSSGGYVTYSDWQQWMPDLFVKRGVDLVLNGHDHLYSVTKRLRGIRYVVTGGGGASLYACRDPAWPDFCRSRHHFLYVVAGKRRIWVRAVPPDGKPFHSFWTGGRPPG